MKKIITVFIISLSSIFLGFGQEGSISGKVVEDKDEISLIGASLRLTHLIDSTISFITVSNEFGNFEFKNIPFGPYSITIGYVGYEQKQMDFKIETPIKELGILTLLEDTKKLKEIVIKEDVIPVTLKGDTTVVDAKAYKSNPDANAEDLIRKMPGITSQNGEVQAQGEKVQKVLVDGKEFFGEDPNLALKNLPAEVISKIEIFDQLSEQSQFSGYDDGQTTKTINIVTKVEMRNGTFGQIYAGVGNDDRYKAGGNINQFNGDKRLSVIGLANNVNQQNFSNEDLLGVLSSGNNRRRGGRGRGGQRNSGGFGRSSAANNFLIGQQDGITATQSFGINFSNKWSDKVDINGSYFFNRSVNNSFENLERETFIANSGNQFYTENNQAENVNYNHRINLRVNYQLNRKNSIIITPRFSFQDNALDNDFLGTNSTAENSLLSQTENASNSNNDGYNFSNNLLFRHRFGKRGRTLSVSFRTTITDNNTFNRLDAINEFYGDNGVVIDSLQQATNVEAKGYNIQTNVVYTEPLFEKSQLQLTYRNGYVKNLRDNRTFNLFQQTGEIMPLDTALSNDFQNDYVTHHLGVGIMKRAKNVTLRTSLGYQYADLRNAQFFPLENDLKRKFNNILPRLMLRINISKEKNLRVFYRSQTNMPSISQLQNVVDNSNPLLLSSGNDQLKQDFTHTLMTRYSHNNLSKSSSLFLLLMVSKTNDYIGNNTIVAERDTVLTEGITLNRGSQFSKPSNLDGYWNARTFLSYGMPINFLKSNLNFNSGITYSRVPGLTNGIENISQNTVFTQGVVLGSNISERVDFTISYNGSYNIVRNSIQSTLNDNFYLHAIGMKFNWIFWKGINLRNDLNQQMYRGLSSEFNQDFLLWNVSVGKKLFKHERGEIRITVFDLLNKNRSINRSVTETYIEDVNTQVLQQYMMVSFIYNVRNFKTGKER